MVNKSKRETMKRCTFSICVLLTVISASKASAEWSIKPYAQVGAGINYLHGETKEHIVHHWQNWAYPAAHYYFVHNNQTDLSRLSFGTTYELGGDFRYDWFYAALGVNYNTGGNIVKNWSSISMKLGGTYKIITPYVKIGTLLHNKTKFGSINSGILVGLGGSVKIFDNLYFDVSYDINKLKHRANLSEYYAANRTYAKYLFPDGFFGTEEEMKLFFGYENHRLADIKEQSQDMMNHTLRTSLKYVF